MIYSNLQEYTDQESYFYVKEYFPNTYRMKLKRFVKLLSRHSKRFKRPLDASLNALLRLTTEEYQRIYLMAAYYQIKIKDTMKPRNLSLVQKELYECRQNLSRHTVSNASPEDKQITREALTRRIFELEEEMEALFDRQQVDPNQTITATLIDQQGFEITI